MATNNKEVGMQVVFLDPDKEISSDLSDGRKFVFDFGILADDNANHIIPLTFKTGNLTTNYVPEASRLLLSEGKIDNSVRLIAGDSVKTIKTIYWQVGRKAHILQNNCLDNQGNLIGKFATYLSINNDRNPLGQEAFVDFQNLKLLSSEAEKRLTPEAKNKYNFINPIDFGTQYINGWSYQFFTMPFVEDYGELNARYCEKNGVVVPYFKFAVNIDERFEKFAQKMDSNANKIAIEKLKIERSCSGPRNQEKREKRINIFLNDNPLQKQIIDVLTGNSLIYLLSDSKFPNEFLINAGDWMMQPSENGINLCLITVRGGFKEIKGSSQEEKDANFIKLMEDHCEKVYLDTNINQTLEKYPIFADYKHLVPYCLNRAKGMLKTTI